MKYLQNKNKIDKSFEGTQKVTNGILQKNNRVISPIIPSNYFEKHNVYESDWLSQDVGGVEVNINNHTTPNIKDKLFTSEVLIEHSVELNMPEQLLYKVKGNIILDRSVEIQHQNITNTDIDPYTEYDETEIYHDGELIFRGTYNLSRYGSGWITYDPTDERNYCKYPFMFEGSSITYVCWWAKVYDGSYGTWNYDGLLYIYLTPGGDDNLPPVQILEFTDYGYDKYGNFGYHEPRAVQKGRLKTILTENTDYSRTECIYINPAVLNYTFGIQGEEKYDFIISGNLNIKAELEPTGEIWKEDIPIWDVYYEDTVVSSFTKSVGGVSDRLVYRTKIIPIRTKLFLYIDNNETSKGVTKNETKYY